jgi:hypothetical protein
MKFTSREMRLKKFIAKKQYKKEIPNPIPPTIFQCNG